MNLDQAMKRKLLEAIAGTLIDNADHLTDLDQAIGDGDHGTNMKRGMEAVLAETEDICAKSLGDGLKTMGMKLVMKVGGASGPLFGTLCMDMGKHIQSDVLGQAEFQPALDAAIEAVKSRGKSDAGQKTMLDVLVPVSEKLATEKASLEGLAEAAQEAADATIPMLAIKGRASFLGERSIGHMDPGACSVALITQAICRTLGEST